MWTKIENILESKGMAWADLARLIGVQDSRISKWRSGTGEIDRLQLLRVAKALEVGVEYLADDSLEDPRTLYRLPEDEAAILRFYRSMKVKGELDEADAIAGMAGMARRAGPPVVLTGDAAKEAGAASQDQGFIGPAPKVHRVPKSNSTRRKA